MKKKRNLFWVVFITFLVLWVAGEGAAQQLTINMAGNGSGTVTSTPAGIDCGPDCSESYPPGTKITLKAKADSGATFKGWSGACTGTKTTCKMTLNADQVVTATFDLPDLHGQWSDITVKQSKSNYEISGKLTVYSEEVKGTNVKVRVYLSNDNQHDGSDTLLGSVNFGTINAGSSKVKNLKYKVTTNPSGEYLFAEIDLDNTIPESNEGNNTDKSPIGGNGGPIDDSLAVKLYAATDEAAVQPILQQIYDYLGVGLYTTDGEQLLAGAERGPDDFYMYDFESGLMARAYLNRQIYSAESLAEFLGKAGVVSAATNQPITGGELLALLSSAVQRSRGDKSLLTLRLIDILGMVKTEPLDLTQPGLDPATTYLDAVQFFLISYDVLAEVVVGAGESAPAQAAAPPFVKASAACDFQGNSQKGRQGGEIGGTLTGDLKKLHDDLIGMGYKVDLQPVKPATHWKHSGGDSGRDVEFQASVEFKLGEARKAIRCGKELRIPDEGPQSGVLVYWEWEGWEDQGYWTWTPTGPEELPKGFVHTDASGKAYATFYPFTEKRPGDGLLTEKQVKVLIGFVDPDVAHGERETTLTVARHMPITMKYEGEIKFQSAVVEAIWKAAETYIKFYTFGVFPGSQQINLQALAGDRQALQNEGGVVEGEGIVRWTLSASVGIGGVLCICSGERSDSVHISATLAGKEKVALTVAFTDLGGTITVSCPEFSYTAPMPPYPWVPFTFHIPFQDRATVTFPNPLGGYETWTLLEQ